MKYKVTLETLTPLHIGTGTELLKDFDYVSKTGEDLTYVLDQDAVYAEELRRGGAAAQLDRPPAKLLSSEHWREGSPFVRYTLRGSTTIEQVREQIKDVQGRCYLPGSSLKGAFRTALMAYAIGAKKFTPEAVPLKPEKSWAAQPWEQAIFGKSPNHDILRVLQVADSQSAPVSPSPLELCAVRVFGGEDETPGAPVVVEAVRPSVVFATEVTIDELALQYADARKHPTHAKELDWRDRWLWLASLIEILQQASERHIAEEETAARDKGFETAADFYTRLREEARLLHDAPTALLQMGWGTGWNGMTVGPLLSKAMQDDARRRYKLGRPPNAGRDWTPNLTQPFPKSRRLRTIESSVTEDRPGQPLGWVKVTFEPVGLGPSAHGSESLWAELTQQASAAFTPMSVAPTSPPQPKTRPARAPASITPQPKPVAAPKAPLTAEFAALPEPGARFRGKVIDTEPSGKIFVELPGLSPDDVAIGVIELEDNPERRKFNEGTVITCEVLAVNEDPQQQGFYLVKCRRA
jgi:CRISPR-associated protein Csm5